MAKILHFEDFLSKRELARIERWAVSEFASTAGDGKNAAPDQKQPSRPTRIRIKPRQSPEPPPKRAA
jgi:hypothetical protein